MPSVPHSPIPLDDVRVASPCHESWDDMAGDDRVRHCARCRLNVYNLSEMTRSEAEAILRGKEGRLCVRFYRRADGTVLTRDCPVGLSAARWRMLRTVAGGIALSSSLLAGVVGIEGCRSHRVVMGDFVSSDDVSEVTIPCVECQVLHPGRQNCPACGGTGKKQVFVEGEAEQREIGKEMRRRVENATICAHPVEASQWEVAHEELRAALEMALACGPSYAAGYQGIELPSDAAAAESLRAKLRDSLRDAILDAERHIGR